jgi:hypothetical protein
MASYVGSCSTLYQAGGSGSNLIPDGYVRAVEKIWLDSFTWGLTTSPSSSDTILIGYIPANKKLVGCEVYLPTTFAPTSCAINVGPSYSSSLIISNATGYISGAVSTGTLINCKVSLNNPSGMGFCFTSSTTAVSGSASIINYVNTPIYLTLGVASITAPTIGTITTILRYT